MEKEGLKRCLTKVTNELSVHTLATDRSIQCKALLRNKFPAISHQFDVWHFAKSVSKRLVAAGKASSCRALLPWIQSIINHLWWSAQTCNGDRQLLVEKWTTIVHHIVKVHSWTNCHKFHHCDHDDLSQDTQRKKNWLSPNSPAHEALKDILFDRTLLSDIERLNEFCHTGQLEVYHSLLTKYCPKRQHFSYHGMIVRTELAIIDHNYNTNHPQATDRDVI